MKNRWEQSSTTSYRPNICRALLTFLILFSGIVSACGGGEDTEERLPITWIVDQGGHGNFTTVNQCISAAINMDTCLVYPGTFCENIDFLGKAITIISADGPDATILSGDPGDCDSEGDKKGPVVTFENGEGNGSVLDGFTIRNGLSSDHGGGIYIQTASPVIQNCIITGNDATIDGGGIYCFHSSSRPAIRHTIFFNNRADNGRGGALCAVSASPLLFNCLFYDNTAQMGGASSALYDANPSVINCTFSENTASAQGGALYAYESSFTLENSILYFDTAPAGAEGFMDRTNDSASLFFSYTDLEAGVDGIVCGSGCGNVCNPSNCITESENPVEGEPGFVTGPEGAFYLYHKGVDGDEDDSPCVNAGDDTPQNLGLNTRTTRTDQVVDGDNASVLLGNGDGTFQAAVPYNVGDSPSSVAIGNLNSVDAFLDLAVANTYSNNVSVLLGNGDGTFQAAVNYEAGTNPSSVVTGEFNGDGFLDLAVANQGSYNVSVLLGNGDGTFQPAVNYGAGTTPSSVAIGDFNGDGYFDLAVTNTYSNNVSVLLGNGNGTFQPAVSYGTGTEPSSVAVGDLNGDALLDLAVANSGCSWCTPPDPGNVSVLLGNGDGTFKTKVNYDAGTNPSSVAIGDFNGGGILDLAVANAYSNNVSVLLGNGDGTFKTAVNYEAGTNPSSVAIGDFNGGGILDLAVANAYSNNVSVLLGNGDGTFQDAANYGAGTNPSSLAIGDFNGGGILDLAVANYSNKVDLGFHYAVVTQ